MQAIKLSKLLKKTQENNRVNSLHASDMKKKTSKSSLSSTWNKAENTFFCKDSSSNIYVMEAATGDIPQNRCS